MIEKIIKYLTEGMYSAFCIENWIKFINLATVMVNFINYYEITPFYHQKSKCWINFSIVAYLVGEMLKKIHKEGSNTYKSRYNRKLENTELESIYKILKP
jgi:hypothetical protein